MIGLAQKKYLEIKGEAFQDQESFIFEKVDHYFAKSISPAAPYALHLFLAYLFWSARLGHLCALIDDNQVIPEPPEGVKHLLIESAKNMASDLLDKQGPLVLEGKKWYLQRNYLCEKRFLDSLELLKKQIDKHYTSDMLKTESLTIEQKNAVIKALNSQVCLVCGGPGTGKTRTAIALVDLFLQHQKKDAHIAICAPTGKATANIRAMLEPYQQHCTVATLHTILQKPYHFYDLMIVDEGSMVDAFLMQKLFSMVKKNNQLIIFGDPDQLPPVGSGNLFKDLIVSEKCEIAFLTKCLRAELHDVVSLSEKIKNSQVEGIEIGELPNYPKLLKEHFFSGSFEEMLAWYKKKRILTPQRKGHYGVDTLNHLFYRYSKDRQASFIPIIIQANDSERGLYNGDFGLLDEKEKKAYFEGGIVHHMALLPSYEYGFALSVHKSQGSEYEEVTILLQEGSEIFGKQMLYTAVTRAKKKVCLYGDFNTLEKILNHEENRLSGLSSHVV